MRRIKCSDATEWKWNLRNMLENLKELGVREQRGDGDQWKQSAWELKGPSDSLKWSERRTDVSAERKTRSDSGRGRDRERRR